MPLASNPSFLDIPRENALLSTLDRIVGPVLTGLHGVETEAEEAQPESPRSVSSFARRRSKEASKSHLRRDPVWEIKVKHPGLWRFLGGPQTKPPQRLNPYVVAMRKTDSLPRVVPLWKILTSYQSAVSQGVIPPLSPWNLVRRLVAQNAFTSADRTGTQSYISVYPSGLAKLMDYYYDTFGPTSKYYRYTRMRNRVQAALYASTPRLSPMHRMIAHDWAYRLKDIPKWFAQRSDLLHHPTIASKLSALWKDAKDDDGTVTRDQHEFVKRRILEALFPRIPIRQAFEMIDLDWDADTRPHPDMSRNLFTKAMFTTALCHCETDDVLEFTRFFDYLKGHFQAYHAHQLEMAERKQQPVLGLPITKQLSVKPSKARHPSSFRSPQKRRLWRLLEDIDMTVADSQSESSESTDLGELGVLLNTKQKVRRKKEEVVGHFLGVLRPSAHSPRSIRLTPKKTRRASIVEKPSSRETWDTALTTLRNFRAVEALIEHDPDTPVSTSRRGDEPSDPPVTLQEKRREENRGSLPSGSKHPDGPPVLILQDGTGPSPRGARRLRRETGKGKGVGHPKRAPLLSPLLEERVSGVLKDVPQEAIYMGTKGEIIPKELLSSPRGARPSHPRTSDALRRRFRKYQRLRCTPRDVYFQEAAALHIFPSHKVLHSLPGDTETYTRTFKLVLLGILHLLPLVAVVLRLGSLRFLRLQQCHLDGAFLETFAGVVDLTCLAHVEVMKCRVEFEASGPLLLLAKRLQRIGASMQVIETSLPTLVQHRLVAIFNSSLCLSDEAHDASLSTLNSC